MPNNNTVVITTTIWCKDCEDENPEKSLFTGEALVTVHGVEEPGGQPRVTFYRAVSPCPNNPNHRRVGDPAERPGV